MCLCCMVCTFVFSLFISCPFTFFCFSHGKISSWRIEGTRKELVWWCNWTISNHELKTQTCISLISKMKRKQRHVYTSSEFRMQIAAISFFFLLFWGNDQQVFTQIYVQCFLAHKLELVPTTICRSIQQHLNKNIYKPHSLLLFLKVSALQ